jgi:DNA-binding NtrC family response regulator
VLILGGASPDRRQLARAFHRASPNSTGAFVCVECGDEARLATAIHEFLSSAEALPGNPVCEANGGTLFLDSIGRLTPRTQRMLLELASRGPGTPAGRWRGRLIIGNGADLGAELESGRFLGTLYDCVDKLRIELDAVA